MAQVLGPNAGLSARAPSASDRAYEWIRAAILKGTYAEGEFLDEVALSEAVSSSRTPVREALRRLHAERFIDIVPRRGAQVRTITAREMQEVYESRLLIESHAVTGLCARSRGAPPDAYEQIEAIDAAGAVRAWNQSAQLDQAFHSSIVSHYGNRVLGEMYDALRPRQVHLAVRTISTAPERFDTIQQEHRALVRALDEHSETRSLEVLRAHLRAIPQLVRAFSG